MNCTLSICIHGHRVRVRPHAHVPSLSLPKYWHANGNKGPDDKPTQLRRNKQKQVHKTSGWKCPHVYEVDLVAAGDADEQLTAQLEAQIHGTELPQPSPEQDAAGSSQQNIDPNVCHECQLTHFPLVWATVITVGGGQW